MSRREKKCLVLHHSAAVLFFPIVFKEAWCKYFSLLECVEQKSFFQSNKQPTLKTITVVFLVISTVWCVWEKENAWRDGGSHHRCQFPSARTDHHFLLVQTIWIFPRSAGGGAQLVVLVAAAHPPSSSLLSAPRQSPVPLHWWEIQISFEIQSMCVCTWRQRDSPLYTSSHKKYIQTIKRAQIIIFVFLCLWVQVPLFHLTFWCFTSRVTIRNP